MKSEVNKISGYILATKTLWTKRIMRIINHKTYTQRINNIFYEHLHECKRRVCKVALGIPEIQEISMAQQSHARRK